MNWTPESVLPRVRVISDNDYAGDPDGLVQLAHHALSPSVDLRAVIGSHLPTHHLSGLHGRDEARDTAHDSAQAARRVLKLAGRNDVTVLAGRSEPLREGELPPLSAAAKGIIAEALRDDTDVPLFVVCGGGLTDPALAWLHEPRIAQRLTLIWIGGRAYPDLGEELPLHPKASRMETNHGIDQVAASAIFNQSHIPLWQVPQNVYATATVSQAELLQQMAAAGPLGAHLFERLGATPVKLAEHGYGLGEVICLGDSPLVLLTALTAGWSRAPESNQWVERTRQVLDADGGYGAPRPDGVGVRIFTSLDIRLLVGDLFAKLSRA